MTGFLARHESPTTQTALPGRMSVDIRDTLTELNMPRVFRVMRKDAADGKPELGDRDLGVRPATDVNLDAQNNVQVDGNGMSVAPNWRDISPNRIPKRLRPLWPGAAGSNSKTCFRHGDGPSAQGAVANGLTLEPDNVPQPTHGNIAPATVVPLATYQADLAATKQDWEEDET